MRRRFSRRKGALGILLFVSAVIALAVSETEFSGIARFKDGDSGTVGDIKIRLRCIDAAEYRSVEGRAAARFAWREIDGEHLSCVRRQRSLSYGRAEVSCTFLSGPHQGRSVNRFLVEHGRAVYVSRSCASEASGW